MYPVINQIFESEKPESIFEIGCASGKLLEYAQSLYGDIKVGGLDISVQGLKEAKETFLKYAENFILHNINDPWPIEDNSYDIVFSVSVLMYLCNPKEAIREMMRVGKKVIISEYHSEDTDEWGGLLKYQNEEKTAFSGSGIYRNYIKLLTDMGYKPRVKFQGLKSIIECQK